MNTRKDADGNKVLFLEEVQSDWGQKGKKEGFAITSLDPKRYEIKKNTFEKDNRDDYVVIDKTKSGFSAEIAFGDTEKEASDLAIKLIKRGVSAAPFVTDTNAWVKLGLKTAIKEAIKKGVDRIAWTTGEQQNERYDLSTKVDEVWYKDGRLVVTDKNGAEVVDRKNVSENELSDIIGKEAAEKLVNQKEEDGAKILNNSDLKIGGSGMKAFYDKIIPSNIKSLIKEITGVDGKIVETDLGDGKIQQSIEITPELKAKVEQEGLPLFSRASLRQELPGYEGAMKIVERVIADSKKKGRSEKEIIDNVMNHIMGSGIYLDANNIQQEQIIRDIRARFGLKEKQAPSVGRLLGDIKDIKKITMSEKSAIKEKIKNLVRGGRDAKLAINRAGAEVTSAVKKLASSGSITSKQAANILRRFDKTNVLSETSVRKFTDYMAKVFSDAEYADNLKKATTTKKQISKLSNNEEKYANLRTLGKEFARIDPSLVDDINGYNEIASKIKESLSGSSMQSQSIKFADIINVDKAKEYINKTLESQDEKLEKEMMDEIQELMGIDASDLSAEEMMSLLNDKQKPVPEYNKVIIKDTIKKAFDTYSSIIKSMLKTGKDAFTGEDISLSESEKDVVSRFMDMDLNLMDAREALDAVDALNNFLQNKSTAKMENVISKNTAEVNGKFLVDKGIKARELSYFGLKGMGRFLAEQINVLPIVFEKMFPGVGRSSMVMEKIGMTNLENKVAQTRDESLKIVNKYVKEFFNKKANGEEFNTRYNNVERQMSAYMQRTVIGTDRQMDVEFKRRKGLVKEAIETLKQGNEQEVEKAELYEKAYDKIVKDSKNIDDVVKSTDKTNLEAIEFWQKEFSDRFEKIQDVSKNVYNIELKRDINYTPDIIKKISSYSAKVDLSDKDSSFHTNTGTLLKQKSGSLMEVDYPETLKEDEEFKSYLDFDFDKNMSNSMHDVLMDINTAAAIRQVNYFLNSKNFKKVFQNSEDATLMKGTKSNPGLIESYVNDIRNKSFHSTDEFSKTVKSLNRAANFGVGLALMGLKQPLAQTIPIAMNTLINAGLYDISSRFNIDKWNFVNNSGHSIAIRGIESQAEIESFNKMIKDAAESKGEAALRKLEEANKYLLKMVLAKPDIFIAKTSWLAYYEAGLKKQGIDPSKFDYKNDKVNEEAANYATRMVDRQQNPSDHSLVGGLFKTKDSARQFIVKTLMSFASFRMNQASRLSADIIALRDKTTSKEDREIAMRSLGGYAVEMVSFKSLSIVVSLLLGSAALKLMNKSESEEEYEKRKANLLKAQTTGAVTEALAPIPLLDVPIQKTVHFGLDEIQNIANVSDENKVNIYDVRKEDFIKSLGSFGIAIDRAGQLYDLGVLAKTGKFKDDYGKDKWISVDDQKALSYLIAPSLMSALGLAPSEVNTVVRYSIKNAKKDASEQEGGKTRDDIETDEAMKSKSEENKLNKEEKDFEKIKVLKSLRETNLTPKEKQEIDNQISILSMTEDELKEYKKERKKESFYENMDEEKLLQGYESKEEMKRYDPILYEKTFGKSSNYYKENEAESKIEKLMNDKLREQKDREHNYVKPAKKKKKKW
jgi:hypothetical protein